MSFLGLPAQDLGEDFEFESDSRSLGEILREEKAPSSRLQQISTANQKVKTAATLTPVRVKPPSKSLLGQDLELFQTKSGALFWRELENGKGKLGSKMRHFPILQIRTYVLYFVCTHFVQWPFSKEKSWFVVQYLWIMKKKIVSNHIFHEKASISLKII